MGVYPICSPGDHDVLHIPSRQGAKHARDAYVRGHAWRLRRDGITEGGSANENSDSDKIYVQFFVDFLGAAVVDKSGSTDRHYAILDAGAVSQINSPIKPGSAGGP